MFSNHRGPTLLHKRFSVVRIVVYTLRRIGHVYVLVSRDNAPRPCFTSDRVEMSLLCCETVKTIEEVRSEHRKNFSLTNVL